MTVEDRDLWLKAGEAGLLCAGIPAEYPVATAFADARVQKIYGGANEVMKELIARSL